MTRMATTRSASRPCWLAWNACAVPAKFVEIVDGRTWLASFCTAATASPMETLGRRLKEIVTAGTWPAWFTDRGPRLAVSFATAPKGTRDPDAERTYSMFRAERSFWYWGSSSMITQYSLFGV